MMRLWTTDRDVVVSRWVCGFMLGEERILLCVFISFHVCDAWGIEVQWQNTISFAALLATEWTEQNTLFRVGLGFLSCLWVPKIRPENHQ